MSPALSQEAHSEFPEQRFSLAASAYKPFCRSRCRGRSLGASSCRSHFDFPLRPRSPVDIQPAPLTSVTYSSSPMLPPPRAEREAFLRASVVAKEELCATLISENQQLSRLLEEGKTRHRVAVEKVKEEASAAVHQLLEEVRSAKNGEDSLRLLIKQRDTRLQQLELRVRREEKARTDAEEKLRVLKRFVEGLQEKQKAVEAEGALYSSSFFELREGVAALARDVSAAVSADAEESKELLPEAVTRGLSSLQVKLAHLESRLALNGCFKGVGAKALLQSVGEEQGRLITMKEATRLQREAKLWENKFERADRESKKLQQEVKDLKADLTKKSDLLLKLRMKEHRQKEQQAALTSAFQQRREALEALKKVTAERDSLAAWKSQHPLYRGHRWKAPFPSVDVAEKKSETKATKPLMAASASTDRKSLLQSAFSMLTPKSSSPSKSVPPPLSRSPSQLSVDEGRRRVPSVLSSRAPSLNSSRISSAAASPSRSSSLSPSRFLAELPSASSAFPAESNEKLEVRASGTFQKSSIDRRVTASSPSLSLLSRQSLSVKQNGMLEKSPSFDLPAKAQSFPIKKQKSSSAVSLESDFIPLRVPLPQSPRRTLTPNFASTPRRQQFDSKDKTAETPASPDGRLADFFASAFTKAADREKQFLEKRQETGAEKSDDLLRRKSPPGSPASLLRNPKEALAGAVSAREERGRKSLQKVVASSERSASASGRSLAEEFPSSSFASLKKEKLPKTPSLLSRAASTETVHSTRRLKSPLASVASERKGDMMRKDEKLSFFQTGSAGVASSAPLKDAPPSSTTPSSFDEVQRASSESKTPASSATQSAARVEELVEKYRTADLDSDEEDASPPFSKTKHKLFSIRQLGTETCAKDSPRNVAAPPQRPFSQGGMPEAAGEVRLGLLNKDGVQRLLSLTAKAKPARLRRRNSALSVSSKTAENRDTQNDDDDASVSSPAVALSDAASPKRLQSSANADSSEKKADGRVFKSQETSEEGGQVEEPKEKPTNASVDNSKEPQPSADRNGPRRRLNGEAGSWSMAAPKLSVHPRTRADV